MAAGAAMAPSMRSSLKRVPVATVVRVGVEVVLVSALLLVALSVRDQACMPVGRWATSPARRWACAPAVVDAKPACCGPGCRGDLGRAASHYDKKYFQWQVRASCACGGYLDVLCCVVWGLLGEEWDEGVWCGGGREWQWMRQRTSGTAPILAGVGGTCWTVRGLPLETGRERREVPQRGSSY